MEVPKKILRKLEKPRRGPFTVTKHHGNGTVAIQESPCAAENASARRLGPFFEQALPLEASAARWHLGEHPFVGVLPQILVVDPPLSSQY